MLNPYSLLPNFFTTLNLLSGFFAIIAVINGHLVQAGWAILFAIVFDIFDGRIARFLGQSSRFGTEYDSLCDLVSFGIAPAILIYVFSLKTFGRAGWLACFLYTACVALRLARFNVRIDTKKNYFEGLPSPAGGAFLASMVIVLSHFGKFPPYKNLLLLILVYIISYLLVSPVKYPSFKDVKIKKSQSFYFLVLFVLILSISGTNPPVFILSAVILYTLLGPFYTLKLVFQGSKENFSWKKEISQEKLTKTKNELK